jgi:hypothetical protein
MLESPQTIDLYYKGKRHYFYVYRYATDQEILDAMHRDKITDAAAYEKGVLAYTDCYAKGEECGRMYLLDKSVDTMAHEATHMALAIIARSGHDSIVATTDIEPELSHDLCYLVGHITSELYSKNKHF